MVLPISPPELHGAGILVPSSDALVPNSFLFLVVSPGATSSVLAPSSDALCYY